MGLLRPVGLSFICRAFLLKSPSVERSAPRPEKATAALLLYVSCYLSLHRPALRYPESN